MAFAVRENEVPGTMYFSRHTPWCFGLMERVGLGRFIRNKRTRCQRTCIHEAGKRRQNIKPAAAGLNQTCGLSRFSHYSNPWSAAPPVLLSYDSLHSCSCVLLRAPACSCVLVGGLVWLWRREKCTGSKKKKGRGKLCMFQMGDRGCCFPPTKRITMVTVRTKPWPYVV